MSRLAWVLAAMLALGACGSGAAQPGAKPTAKAYAVSEVAGGLDAPWGMAFLPDGAVLVTEKAGRLRVVRNGKLEPGAIAGVPAVRDERQGGLLDVAVHPDFAANKLVYLAYSAPSKDAKGETVAATALGVGRLEGAALKDFKVLFERNPKSSSGLHFGARILFLPDQTILLTLGDGFKFRDEAQNLSTHWGKTVRMDQAGRPPKDNPFLDQAGADPLIYSYGHRNVQGAAIDRATGRVYVHEHGPRGGDEVNVLRAGVNYGWPAITYGVDYSGAVISPFTEKAGMAQPLVKWVPSIAPSGMTFYDGALFPQWRGDLFVGALAGQHLRRIDLGADGKVLGEQKLLEELGARIRDVRTGPDGALYLLTDEPEGRLLRVAPQGK